MPDQGRISTLQVSMFIANTIMMFAVVVPLALVAANRDAWLGSIAVGLAQHLLLLVSPAFRFPGQPLGTICRTVLGKTGGSVALLTYLLFFLIFDAAVLRASTDLLVTAVFPSAPIGLFLLVMIGLAAYGGRHGFEVLCRCSQMLFPVILGGVLVTIGLVLPMVRAERLLPVLERGAFPLYRSTLYAPITLAEVTFLPSVAAMVTDRQRLRSTLHLVMILVTVVVSGISGVVVGVLGEPGAVTATYPVFEMIRQVDIGDFLQRVEPLFMSIIMTGYFLRSAFYLYAVAFTLAELLHLEEYRSLVIPCAVIVALLAARLAESQRQYLSEFVPFVLAPLTWLIGLVLPLALRLVAGVRSWTARGRPSEKAPV